MSDDHPDPVRVRISASFDRRFAGFDVRTDNAPTESGSVAVRGFVNFNERRHQTEGRVYVLGIRSAFLDVLANDGSFTPESHALWELQKGSYASKLVSKRQARYEGGGGASASANIYGHAALRGGANANALVVAETMTNKAITPEKYRVRWVAGGFQFGGPSGDPLSESGTLQGLFLNEKWGELCPYPGATRYGVSLKLIIPSGSISVEPEERRLFDMVRKRSVNESIIEELKKLVAAWSIESQLISSDHKGGYDTKHDEFVVAHAQVDVDLRGWLKLGSEGQTATPAPLLLTVAKDVALSTRNRRKRTPKNKQEPGRSHERSVGND